MEQGFIEDNVVILSKQTIEAFFKHEKPMEIMGLYIFYYYTAKWQKTNQPKCTTLYTATGLKWTKDKVVKNKRLLMDMGLIENVRKTNKNGRVASWYIRLNYIWRQGNIPNMAGSPQSEKPVGWKIQRVENSGPNALSVNNINALSDNNKCFIMQNQNFAENSDNTFLNNSLEKINNNPINVLLDLFKLVNKSYTRFFSNKTERTAIEFLLKENSFDEVKKWIENLEWLNQQPYAPTITTPLQLKNKIGEYQSFIQKKQNQIKLNENQIINKISNVEF